MTEELTAAESAVLDRLPQARWAEHGIPTDAMAAVRERAAAVVAAVLGGTGRARISPLGAGWSRDIDIEGDLQAMRRLCTDAGWLPLDGWLAAIGSPARDVWAIVDQHEVLGAADLSQGDLSPAEGPHQVSAGSVGRRARRRGEVRVREVLELLRLAGADDAMPADPKSDRPPATGDAQVDAAVTALLADPDQAPIPLARSGWRHAAGQVRSALRPTAVVAVCGVDGAGKSTVTTALQQALERCGLPVGRVWARPGMNIGLLEHVARRVKRASGGTTEPGVRAVAAGDADVASRRGVLGWVWSLLIVLAFAIDVRRQHTPQRGVILYDRHRADAAVTIDVLYGGGDRRLQRWLAVRALPTATVTAYLQIDVATSLARKPDDTIGEHAVTAQLARYEQALSAIDDVLVLDGTQPVAKSVQALVRALPAPS